MASSTSILLLCLSVAISSQFVNSRPIVVDNNRDFQTRSIEPEDFAATRCGFGKDDGCSECVADDCPYNAFGFLSQEIGPDGRPVTPDGDHERLATIGTTIGGIPQLVMLHCKSNCSQFVLPPQDPGSSFWTNVIENRNKLRANPQDGSLNMDLLNFGSVPADNGNFNVLGLQVEELIEYEDVDGDAQFTPATPEGKVVDKVIQRMPVPSSWQEATFRTWYENDTDASTDQLDHSANYEYTIISKDGTVKMRYTMIGVPSVLPNDRGAEPIIITPRSTLVEFSLKNIRYQSPNPSRVAVKVILLSNQGDTFLLMGERQVLVADKATRIVRGSLMWESKASAKPTAGPAAGYPVVASAPLEASIVEMSYSITKSIVTSNTKATPKAMYFSIKGECFKPESIEWAFSMNMGRLAMAPQISQWPLFMVLCLLSVISLCVVYQGTDNILPCWYFPTEKRCLPFITKERFALLGSQDKEDAEPGSELGQPLLKKNES